MESGLLVMIQVRLRRDAVLGAELLLELTDGGGESLVPLT